MVSSPDLETSIAFEIKISDSPTIIALLAMSSLDNCWACIEHSYAEPWKSLLVMFIFSLGPFSLQSLLGADLRQEKEAASKRLQWRSECLHLPGVVTRSPGNACSVLFQ